MGQRFKNEIGSIGLRDESLLIHKPLLPSNLDKGMTLLPSEAICATVAHNRLQKPCVYILQYDIVHINMYN